MIKTLILLFSFPLLVSASEFQSFDAEDTYSEAKFLPEVTKFNDQHKAKCKSAEKERCGGFAEIKVEEVGGVVDLAETTVLVPATATNTGDPDGLAKSEAHNLYRKVVIYEKVGSVEGQLIPLKDGKFFGISSTMSCLGNIPDGPVKLIDTKAKTDLFEHNFTAKDEELNEIKVSEDAEIKLSVRSVSRKDPSRKLGCNGLKTVEFIDREYRLNCKAKCTLTKSSEKKSLGCELVGTCD